MAASRLRELVLLLALAGCWAGGALATDAAQLERERKGKALLTLHCTRCHAVGIGDTSPLEAAPPLGDIYKRYPTKELEAVLSEGAVSRHKAMPQVEFSDAEVAAIMTYLYRVVFGK
jgi:mono/diheme cytochrome c family protein